MYVKYIYANRDNYEDKGIHISWIKECEKCNYIFEVVGDYGNRWRLKTTLGYTTTLKERCIEYIEEYITLPKELFEI